MHVNSSSAVQARQKKEPKKLDLVDCFYDMLPESQTKSDSPSGNSTRSKSLFGLKCDLRNMTRSTAFMAHY